MATRIQVRRDTAANWTSQNPTLAAGEIGFETNTGEFKIGTGTDTWSALPYGGGSGGATTLDGLTDVVITAATSGDILRHNGTNWVDAVGTTHFEVAGAVATHEADTTSVHGIADTSTLYRSGGTDVAIADGGTGASDASTARTNLGLGTAALISSTAGGDLSGTLPSPTVAKINGVAVTGTPSVGYVPTATSSSAATWQAAASGGVATGAPARSGAYYRRRTMPGGNATFNALTLNRLYATRIQLEAGTLDRIIAQHGTATGASEVFRMGIYNDSSGRPGTLLLDAGTIDLSTAVAVKSITISQAVTAGYYWIAGVHQGGTTAQLLAFSDVTQMSDFGQAWSEMASSSTLYDTNFGHVYIDSISSTLPTPFGTATIPSGSSTQNPPTIAVRYA